MTGPLERRFPISGISLTDLDWQVRLHIYRRFTVDGRPPAYQETALALDIPPEAAREAYHRLHRAHQIFLDTSDDCVRMASPLSAVTTPYAVITNGRRLYANCAWDSLGIPAMLHADAVIESRYTHTGEPASYAVENGRLSGAGVVHFLLPFRRWYEDLVYT